VTETTGAITNAAAIDRLHSTCMALTYWLTTNTISYLRTISLSTHTGSMRFGCFALWVD
jgi:hypothetical protein